MGVSLTGTLYVLPPCQLHVYLSWIWVSLFRIHTWGCTCWDSPYSEWHHMTKSWHDICSHIPLPYYYPTPTECIITRLHGQNFYLLSGGIGFCIPKSALRHISVILQFVIWIDKYQLGNLANLSMYSGWKGKAPELVKNEQCKIIELTTLKYLTLYRNYP